MRKACTELKNKYMESFLKNCGLFEITAKQDPQPPQYIYNPVCSKCGFVNAEGAQFCAKDGTSLKQQVENYTLTTTCPKCQAVNPEGALFCTQCGTSLKITSVDLIYSQKFDILFCDSVDYHDKKIQAEKKVYLACNQIEYINEMHRFDDFGYYIGFGIELYNKLEQEFGFETSKVLDGFVYDQKYEDQFEDKEFDIFVVGNSIDINIKFVKLVLFYFLEIKYWFNKLYGKKIIIATDINGFIPQNLSSLKEDFKNYNNFEEIINQSSDVIKTDNLFSYKKIKQSNKIFFFNARNYLFSIIDRNKIISANSTFFLFSELEKRKEKVLQSFYPTNLRPRTKEEIIGINVKNQSNLNFIYSINSQNKEKNDFSPEQYAISKMLISKNYFDKNISNVKNVSDEFKDIINKI